jgi:hypothetical protein
LVKPFKERSNENVEKERRQNKIDGKRKRKEKTKGKKDDQQERKEGVRYKKERELEIREWTNREGVFLFHGRSPRNKLRELTTNKEKRSLE